MNDNVRLLEELVADAISRLKRLRTEREALRGELDELRERLEATRRERADADGTGDPDSGWSARRAQALAVLREALSDLKAN